MFTEDDDKVVVNNDKNSEYANFYTSFINDEKNKKKTGKDNSKKKKADEKKTEETDNANFYTSFLENERLKKEPEEKESNSKKDNKKETKESINNEEYDDSFEYDENDFPEVYQFNENNDNKKRILKIVALALGIIFVIFLIIFIISKIGGKPGIILTNDNITINVGESHVISYKIVNPEDKVESTFSSNNLDVAVVDNYGNVTGISQGETEIIVSYTISGKTKKEKCKVKVNGEGTVNKNVTIDTIVENGSPDVWTKNDVSIVVNAKSIYGVKSIQYAINCDSNNCSYKDVVNNRINVTNNGINNVIIVAKDERNQETKKQVTLKIDKEMPTITFNEKNTITSSSDVNVCATCSDNLSGCKKEKVCVKYTSSKSNQNIVVEDNAGNKALSPSFNVVINKKGSNSSKKCSLKVSSDGTVTATVPSGAKYYGFSSSYSGTNTKSKKISINVANGQARAQLIYYYFIASNGTKGNCQITVIKDCTKGTCTFRAS